jgi:hypothetical protein
VGGRIGAEESRAADPGERAAGLEQRSRGRPILASVRRLARRGGRIWRARGTQRGEDDPAGDLGRPILASARRLARRGGRIGAEERRGFRGRIRRSRGIRRVRGLDGGREEKRRRPEKENPRPRRQPGGRWRAGGRAAIAAGGRPRRRLGRSDDDG